MKILMVLVWSLLLAACVPAASGVSTASMSTVVAATPFPADYTPPPVPTQGPPTAIPSLPGGFSPTELKYRLLEQYPDFFYCDPDLYPIAIGDEMELALQHFPEIQADAGEFQAILSHNGLKGLSTFSDSQKLLIYQEHKKLNALFFELSGNRYIFQFQTGDESKGQGFLVSGSVDAQGDIHIDSREPGIVSCPICLARGTQIDTPDGPVAVEDLQVGRLIWTLNSAGMRVAAPILQTGQVRAPASHSMIHLVLKDGRQLWASPRHPLADGHPLMGLKPGLPLDGSIISSLEWVPYRAGFTYDILPSGGTGFYWANGILMASTLLHPIPVQSP
jgi:hypothetical protein